LLVRGDSISGFKIQTDGEEVEGATERGKWQHGVQRAQSNLKLSILSTKQADPATVSDRFNQIAPLNPENGTLPGCLAVGEARIVCPGFRNRNHENQRSLKIRELEQAFR
jgi:hypothetical protein